MCGICGAIDFSEPANAADLVRRMNPTMFHRGPDDEGYLDRGRLSLGMRRLSIIDIEGGHQPIFNETGTIGVVLNGEIYNFQQLQEELRELGHNFRTRSDSEVIAHAYEEWGSGCVARLDGMFAIAVYDRRSSESPVSSSESNATNDAGTLFLARDRLGIKPLYYYAQSSKFRASSFEYRVAEQAEADHEAADNHGTDNHRDTESTEGAQRSSDPPRPQRETRNSKLETFLFASEVRTLLASGIVPRKLSRAAVESYLLFGSVSEPMTLVEGIFSLPPGHHLTIALGSEPAAINVRKYWSIAKPPSRNGHSHETNPKAIAKHVRRLLQQSVRSHLIADVPVGVFLSSGIDSTALAALACREVAGVHTFTVGFPEDKFSETTIARKTAERLGATHREVMLSGDEMLARLDEAVAALDLPTIDGINTYFVSASARAAGLKVALSGLGGDEVFGGYSTFRRTPQYQRFARAGNHLPAGLKTAMSAAMAEAGGRFLSGDAARKLAALWKDSKALPDPYYFGRMLFTPAQVSGLMPAQVSGSMKDAMVNEPQSPWWEWLSESALQAKQLDSFAAVSCLEAQSYLVNTLLRDTDSMSMAHSLEVRVPFLDHSLVEFVTHLPQAAKLAKGTPKALLVAALADLLPDEIVQQTKRGFTFPWETWLRGPLKDKLENGLAELSPALSEVLDGQTTRGVWQSYLDGKTKWSRPWSLYVLNEWTKKHLG